jgi:hypothetical protein
MNERHNMAQAKGNTSQKTHTLDIDKLKMPPLAERNQPYFAKGQTF